jgi:hypothetical protein
MWCVIVCDLETLMVGGPGTRWAVVPEKKHNMIKPILVAELILKEVFLYTFLLIASPDDDVIGRNL